MLAECLFVAALQVGPFFERRPDLTAVRPFYAREGETLDVLWPLYRSHRDWWSFLLVVNWQDHVAPEGYQFSIVPFWFNGKNADETYAGLFPVYGRHPHVLMLYDLEFALWPLWTRYRMRRGDEWLETKTVLFPFVSWRSDGSWSVWPVCGLNRQRESEHRYFCWPFVTWASYREDRDTAGAGSSWMVWPLYGRVRRARESQDLFLPPFFSYAETRRRGADEGAPADSVRLRCPWPFFEYESSAARERLSVWPLYEHVTQRDYATGGASSEVTRFGWKLVEIYDDETRVFPFWASGRDHFRLWPFYESETRGEETTGRFLSLVPIRWIPGIDRSWAKFWTLYESRTCPLFTDRSLFWGLIKWRTLK